ncbi:MAG: NupC/NupG family nucleoside CNT transporter [Cytophagales bacterium]|nr:MAG: NupC/NupG family nucleoside CNT transporter [Cytophagales bacterium]TAF62257.1 MAG: NupC/NupG family nucleoside CNT transporter [Cytophagales bacterium]
MAIIQGIIGLIVLTGVAYLASNNRKAINWKLVGMGFSLQIIFGILVMKVPAVASVFSTISEGFVTVLSFSSSGARFLFGELANSNKLGFIFAFNVLPTIIFFSAVSAGLYYLGVLQKVVYGIAWVMSKTMKLSGAESLSVAGNIFMGQTEAPLLIRPFVAKMSISELNCLMTGGMATLAGGVLAAYVTFLGGDDPEQQALYASFLLSASIMNAPAAVVMSKMIQPEENIDKINTKLEVNQESLGANLIDAVSIGAADGLKLALNVGGMLLAFIAVIALCNYGFDLIGRKLLDPIIYLFSDNWGSINDYIKASTNGQFDKLSLEYVLGQVCRLAAFVMGVEWKDCLAVGSLLGQKTVINEFVAYQRLAEMKNANLLMPKSILISTFALCGFSNFSSIAIQIGGIGGMAPSQQANISRLGLKALLGASLACMLSATVAGAISEA